MARRPLPSDDARGYCHLNPPTVFMEPSEPGIVFYFTSARPEIHDTDPACAGFSRHPYLIGLGRKADEIERERGNAPPADGEPAAAPAYDVDS